MGPGGIGVLADQFVHAGVGLFAAVEPQPQDIGKADVGLQLLGVDGDRLLKRVNGVRIVAAGILADAKLFLELGVAVDGQEEPQVLPGIAIALQGEVEIDESPPQFHAVRRAAEHGLQVDGGIVSQSAISQKKTELRAGVEILGGHLQIELVTPQGRLEVLFRLELPRPVEHEGRLPLHLKGMHQNGPQAQHAESDQAGQQESEVDRGLHITLHYNPRAGFRKQGANH